MGGLALTRTLAIGGRVYETQVTVHEVATDNDSEGAIFLSQDPEDADEDAEPDVVVLTWSEWDEVRDYVESWQDVMPERSTLTATPEQPSSPMVGYSICGERAEYGLCVLADMEHRRHINGVGRDTTTGELV